MDKTGQSDVRCGHPRIPGYISTSVSDLSHAALVEIRCDVPLNGEGTAMCSRITATQMQRHRSYRGSCVFTMFYTDYPRPADFSSSKAQSRLSKPGLILDNTCSRSPPHCSQLHPPQPTKLDRCTTRTTTRFCATMCASVPQGNPRSRPCNGRATSSPHALYPPTSQLNMSLLSTSKASLASAVRKLSSHVRHLSLDLYHSQLCSNASQ